MKSALIYYGEPRRHDERIAALKARVAELEAPPVEPFSMCEVTLQVNGVTFTCDRLLPHDGKHGGIYPSSAGDVELKWA